MERPIPYKGEKGYIFISYAHRDAARVWPIIARMQLDGYRVWYDEGIDPGTEWDENIAYHVTECGYFLAFLSENYMASNNCKDELNFSRDQGKPQVLIYLEEVELPKGMAMRMGRTRALHYEQYPDKLDFFHELYASPGIRSFYKANNAPRPKAGKNAPTTFHKQKKSYVKPILITIALMAVLGIGVYLLLSGVLEKPDPSAETTAQTAPGETTQPEMLRNVLLLENNMVRVTFLDITYDSRYLSCNLLVQNKANSELWLNSYNCYLNGAWMDRSYGYTVPAGVAKEINVEFSLEQLDAYGIAPEEITVVEMELDGRLMDGSGEMKWQKVVLYPYGEDSAQFLTYTPTQEDQVLLDNELGLMVLGESTYSQDGAWHQSFLCLNRSQQELHFRLENSRVNGFDARQYMEYVGTVKPGRMAICQVSVYPQYYLATGCNRVVDVQAVPTVDPHNGLNQTVRGEAFYLTPEGAEAAADLGFCLEEDQIIYTHFDEYRIAYLDVLDINGQIFDVFCVENTAQETQFLYLGMYLENITSPYRSEESSSISWQMELQPGQKWLYIFGRDEYYLSSGKAPKVQITLQSEYYFNKPDGKPLYVQLKDISQ